MHLKDINLVSDLKLCLEAATNVVEKFERAPGTTVSAYANTEPGNFGRGVSVQLIQARLAQLQPAATDHPQCTRRLGPCECLTAAERATCMYRKA